MRKIEREREGERQIEREGRQTKSFLKPQSVS